MLRNAKNTFWLNSDRWLSRTWANNASFHNIQRYWREIVGVKVYRLWLARARKRAYYSTKVSASWGVYSAENLSTTFDLLFFFYISVLMKKPSIIPKLKLEYTAPIVELGLDVESEKAIQLGKRLQDFYFGFTEIKPENILIYLMVTQSNQMSFTLFVQILIENVKTFSPSDSYRQKFRSWCPSNDSITNECTRCRPHLRISFQFRITIHGFYQKYIRWQKCSR